jgi:3',5'-cyclic AMP phosphodiesterase CpdA
VRVYAVSDLHVDDLVNRELVERMPAHPYDWLVVAGDVADRIEDVRWALAKLVDRFALVVWAPGNHELWTHRDEPDAARGVERYAELVEMCRDLGVLTPEDEYPVFQGVDGAVTIAPLFLLYDYSFRPDGTTVLDALRAAKQRGIWSADELFLHADPFASRADWCRSRLAISERRLQALEGRSTMLVSHFPFRRDLVDIPHMPRFELWCGTDRTHDWHLRYHAAVVVSGHLHVRSTCWRDGVAFEEVSVGRSREWRRRVAAPWPRVVLPRPRWLPVAP